MTVAGQQSVAELKDFIRIRDDLQTKLGNAFAAYSPTWVQKDPNAFVDWSNDWAALQGRYAKARANAEKVIEAAKFAPVSDTLIPAQGAFDSVLHAVKQSAPPDGGPVTKGDFDDLVSRLAAAGGDTSSIVALQPTPGLDADLNAMNNPVVQAGANAGADVVSAAQKAAAAAKAAATSPWTKVGLVALGGFALLGGILALRR